MNTRFDYEGDQLNQIAFPLGGLGAGCLHMGGRGEFRDFFLFNTPAFGHNPMHFAALHCADGRGNSWFRVLEGPVQPSKVYDQGRGGNGLMASGHEGLPRMDQVKFRGEFPFALLELTDPAMPINVGIEAWSPIIPGDADSSGLPAAWITYKLRNRLRRTVSLQFSMNVQFPVYERGDHPTAIHNTRGKTQGLKFISGLAEDHPNYATVAVVSPRSGQQANCAWFRGGWFDALSVLADDLEQGKLATARQQQDGPGKSHRFGATLFWNLELGPGETTEMPHIYTWHTPNSDLSYGMEPNRGNDQCTTDTYSPYYHPYYATRFADAWDVAKSAIKRSKALQERTTNFHDALFDSTLPDEVLEAISANLAILKSPTILRQQDGTLWCWEGCSSMAGCCPGSCTHVWNYAQAVAHLFPALERTLRDQEFTWSMDARGHVTYRAALPTSTIKHDFHAAADGQLGGILKLYRDWQICGDDAWLAERYPLAHRSLEYCIQTWDPGLNGVLTEPHHNTYDIEFWGADIMCSGIYLASLQAMVRMAMRFGDADDVARYEDLLSKGRTHCDEELWNGEYYHQSPDWHSTNAATRLAEWTGDEGRINDGAYSSEAMKLMQREGPKYQYGNGCLADGLIGEWFAHLLDLPASLPSRRIRKHLQAVYKYNHRHKLTEHVNPQRPGYALGNEAGLVLCTWPKGGKPSLPFVYSDEVWTGIEYQVASNLIFEGLVEEGLEVVRSARSRYDGRVRNPWNEYECGNYYARALASYALLPALTGFHYSAVEKRLRIAPRMGPTGRFFFATDSAWGSIRYDLARRQLDVIVEEGVLALRQVEVPGTKSRRRLAVEFESIRQVDSRLRIKL